MLLARPEAAGRTGSEIVAHPDGETAAQDGWARALARFKANGVG